ncbi:MAG: ATP-binding cassette domain-containing protein [Dehalococcoidia bacterium]|nr:ATP-binding cassette domain-containing protein [Dehalococcoidia bacterium]
MSGQKPSSIQVKSVQKRYSKFAALSDVTFEVGAGTLFGVLGPSGSGKTTLIRIIAGLLTPTSGEARVFDHVMPDRTVAGRIRYMPQN